MASDFEFLLKFLIKSHILNKPRPSQYAKKNVGIIETLHPIVKILYLWLWIFAKISNKMSYFK